MSRASANPTAQPSPDVRVPRVGLAPAWPSAPTEAGPAAEATTGGPPPAGPVDAVEGLLPLAEAAGALSASPPPRATHVGWSPTSWRMAVGSRSA